MKEDLSSFNSKEIYKSFDEEQEAETSSWIEEATKNLTKEGGEDHIPSLEEIREKHKEIIEWVEGKKSFGELLWEIAKKEDLLKQALWAVIARIKAGELKPKKEYKRLIEELLKELEKCQI